MKSGLTVPTREEYEDWCQCLLAHLTFIKVITGVNNDKNRRRRYRIILDAIETLSGHKRTYGNDTNTTPWDAADPFPGPRDLELPAGVTWEQWMQRTVTPPYYALPFHAAGTLINPANDRTAYYRSAARRDIVRRADQRRWYLSQRANHPYASLPTQKETHWNREHIRQAEWEHANRHTEFAVQDDLGVTHYATVIPTFKDFDNSLWHALSYQVNGSGAGIDNNFLGLRGGRREKAWLYNYFYSGIINPRHPRHRAYTWLQQSEKTYQAQDVNIMKYWGELSILRALSVNKPHGGRAKWPAFPGIFQLIADFFKMEVVVFVGKKGLAIPDDLNLTPAPKSGWRLPYEYHVFGKRAHGLSTQFANKASGNGNGQLFFVTNEDWAEFDALKFNRPFDPKSEDPLRHSFNTGDTLDDHRYGARRYPFLGGAVSMPTSLPDIPAVVTPAATYERPCDNPMFRLPNDNYLVRQSRNDVNFIDRRAGRNGRMPVLPSLAAMRFAWGPAAPAPGVPGPGMVDVTPIWRQPWAISSGGFWQHNTEADTQQWVTGIYSDAVAKLAYDSRNALYAQGEQIETGERRQEPNVLHVVGRVPHIQFGVRKNGKARRIPRRGGELPPQLKNWDVNTFKRYEIGP